MKKAKASVGAGLKGDEAAILKKAQIKGAKNTGGTAPEVVGISADQKLMNKVKEFAAKKKVK